VVKRNIELLYCKKSLGQCGPADVKLVFSHLAGTPWIGSGLDDESSNILLYSLGVLKEKNRIVIFPSTGKYSRSLKRPQRKPEQDLNILKNLYGSCQRETNVDNRDP
jgi:hypothetical protein